MADINPKLNLNKTPNAVDNNSLVFAKNIRLDVDGSIHSDYSIFPMSLAKGKRTVNYVQYNNLRNRIRHDLDYQDTSKTNRYYNTIRRFLEYGDGKKHPQYENDEEICYIEDGKFKIVGTVSDSNDFYLFISASYYEIIDFINDNDVNDDEVITYSLNCIIRYNERTNLFTPCTCNWKWSGGTIDGCVITNLVGDKILNIAETNVINPVPFKSINLNTCSTNDDESIYTQTPNIPLTNFYLINRFSCSIPNGVYQFFVRYRLADNFYTNWFPVSGEFFVGNSNSIVTSFGTLKYTDPKRDSDNSFVISVEHLVESYERNYKDYQVGFILSHDDTIYARAWKHFDFKTTIINFDYKTQDAEEIQVIDLLKTTYGLYNVGNVTSFKNKLYVSNYTETNFNESTLQNIADKIDITINTKVGNNTYDGKEIITTTIGGKDVVSGLKFDEQDLPFIGTDNLFYKIINTSYSASSPSIKEMINRVLDSSENTSNVHSSLTDVKLNINAIVENISVGRDKLETIFKDSDYQTHKIEYNYNNTTNHITKITVNGLTKSKSEVIPYIYNTPRYLTSTCNWINNNGNNDDNIEIIITRTAKLTTTTKGLRPLPTGGNDFRPGQGDDHDVGDVGEIPGQMPGEDIPSETITTSYPSYTQKVNIKFVAYPTLYSSNTAVDLVDYTSLIPYQKYKFYIHFVKSNGEVTNGYYCSNAGEIEIPYYDSCNSVIYPIFDKLELPRGYIACFFSISHTQNKTATIFNIQDSPTTGDKEGSCLDINMLLITGNKNIHIRQGYKGTNENSRAIGDLVPITPPEGGDGSGDDNFVGEVQTYSGKYFYSSDSSLPRYFGADGIVVFGAEGFENGKLAYVVTDYSIPKSDIVELVKCTPYLSEYNVDTWSKRKNIYYYDDYTKMNLLGYICSVSPLVREKCIQYYTDGSSVYYKDYNNATATLFFDELSKYTDADSDKKLSNFGLTPSNNVYIYSNYNLNYVSLSEEPKMSIKTVYNRASNKIPTDTEKNKDTKSMVLRLLTSLTMSSVYNLESMYKSYTRKQYYTYTENSVIRFDNTVRSSMLYGDEEKTYIMKFDADDYYNIPTNRGAIVNLVAVGDAILVHTQDSMFKFSGSNTLQSNDGEIQTTESQPFDTGVSEMFGSDFGFAGIQNKTDHIITENGYIFFDRDSRVVYMYSGNSQITKLSDSIEKLFNHKPIKNIHFANDYYNNRFFMSIIFYDTKTEFNNKNNKYELVDYLYPVTLSFNFSENIKSFVSLHDFYFTYAFNTKTNCYFLNEQRNNVFYVNKQHSCFYSDLSYKDNTYVSKTCNKFIDVLYNDSLDVPEGEIIEDIIENITTQGYMSIVDIIYNNNYETVKTLNAINWCGNISTSDFRKLDSLSYDDMNMVDSGNVRMPCTELRIYTDSCSTPTNKFNRISNDSSITSVNSYKYPRYNQGIWTFNYFRNVKNANRNVDPYVSDQNSLIEGKYFVVRFVFNREFKLETLSFNISNKI